MAQGKESENIAYQDVSVQMQYNDDEICQCFKKCNPPPPPGDEELWDLQFCRWWGWNWVRKRPPENENKKEPKKTFKQFCNCLSFKKGGGKACPLQNLYNTPSNSVVARQTRTTEFAKKDDSIRVLEIERTISQENKRQTVEKNKQCKTWLKAQDDFTSSEECSCYRAERSDTEDSIEYIKIKCCQCRHNAEEQPLEKCNCETQTSERATNVNVTQTNQCEDCIDKSERRKKSKKKRICVICCHCCKCKYQNINCNKKTNANECQSNNNVRENTKKNASNNFTKGMKPTEKKDALNKEQYTSTYHPCNITKYQLEKLLYYSDIPKFPLLQQNYLKHCNTKSVTPTLTNQNKFASPLSGEIYNMSPIKVDTFGQNSIILPDPIDISKDLERIKNFENEFQTDNETRVVLDAICDAILSNNSWNTPSNTILNEVTYSFKEPNFNTNGTHNIDDKLKLPTNSSIFNEVNYYAHLNSSKSNPNSLRKNYFSNNENQKATNTTNIDDIINSLMLNYEFNTTEQTPFRKQPAEPQWVNNLVSDTNAAGIAQPNMKPMKEYLSSVLKPRETKKHDGCNTNISDIFKQIEEIILKSKVNNTEILNVLNVIPNKTSRAVSSEEIIWESKPDHISCKEYVSGVCKMFSDKCSQQVNSPNCNTTDSCKPNKIIPTTLLKDEDDQIKMPLIKRKKKNGKLLVPPVKRSDKFKSSKKK